mgnify:CR=1 FL=1
MNKEEILEAIRFSKKLEYYNVSSKKWKEYPYKDCCARSLAIDLSVLDFRVEPAGIPVYDMKNGDIGRIVDYLIKDNMGRIVQRYNYSLISLGKPSGKSFTNIITKNNTLRVELLDENEPITIKKLRESGEQMDISQDYGTITWYEDKCSGRGYLRLEFEDGSSEEKMSEETIDSSTDSHYIANLFDYDYVSVEHDGDKIHVSIKN